MFSAVQCCNVLILTLLCSLLFNLVELTELPPVWERAANSAYHLLFRCLLRHVCLSFPLMFMTSFGFFFFVFFGYSVADRNTHSSVCICNLHNCLFESTFTQLPSKLFFMTYSNVFSTAIETRKFVTLKLIRDKIC